MTEPAASSSSKSNSSSFLGRHEFLIRRLHSLSGLVPVGAFMCVHLLTNASVLNGPGSFQENVDRIHSLGKLLPLVEWGFIFLPLLFHAFVGVAIAAGAVPNTGSYPYKANIRYTLQRVTAWIALVFIFWHVFHMHGWIHSDWWLPTAKSLNGAQFDPHHAASSASVALQSTAVKIAYAVGIVSCVYHLANGIWTMGITWGVWISPKAQQRATVVCGLFGIGLTIVGLSALWGMVTVDQDKAVRIENKIREVRHAAELSDDNVPAAEDDSKSAK